MIAYGGMILDRALPPELLDIAFELARTSGDRPDVRGLLNTELRSHVSLKEAEGKTKKCLTRVWLNPPEPAREMIHWAVANCGLDPNRRMLHFGAMLATFPFIGSVVAIVGRELALHGQVLPVEVRRQARLALGDRSTIDIGARKVYTTLRYLGMLEQRPGQGLIATEPADIPGGLAGWIAHALMLTRGVGAIDLSELASAPEFFALRFSQPKAPYPLLEMHTEGGNRSVLAERLVS